MVSNLLQSAALKHSQGDLDGAERLYQAVLQDDRHNFDALHLLGVVRFQQRRFSEAVELLRAALGQQAHIAQAHYHLGLVLAALGDHNEALAALTRATTLDPVFAPAWEAHGKSLAALGRHGEAIASYDGALALTRESAEAWNMRGSSLAALARYADAIASWQEALKLAPANPVTLSNIGAALSALHQNAEAINYFQRALAIDPRFLDGLNNYAACLANLYRYDEAVGVLDKAIALAPGTSRLHFSRAMALQSLKRIEDSIDGYQVALALDPEDAATLGQLLLQRRAVCDWDGLSADLDSFRSLIEGGKSMQPFTCVSLSNDPALLMRNAQKFMANVLPYTPTPLWRGERYTNPKVRVAYLGADYRDHALATLIVELLEVHDRSCFEIIGLSYGPNDQSPMRKRMERACDSFHDLQSLSDHAIARWLRENRIDIAVDLTGHCEHGRLTTFAHRAAPVQVNYLGFPGTIGATHVDYIIADRVLIPPEERQYFSEKVVHLPDTYQVTDTTREVSGTAPSRAELGLPHDAFVYCCFNGLHKIGPEMFDVWMRLLRSVDNSVLWLIGGHATAQANLRKRAAVRGVHPDRLVFAKRVDKEANLARYRRADLFLDTLPYNAHTTASDALWAGVPVLTCTGSAFAGRVAASVLLAAGLPELVTHSLAEYEALAARLPVDASLMGDLRRRLDTCRRSAPLFDTDRFRCNIESAYKTMLRIAYEEGTPRAFSVGPEVRGGSPL